MIRPVIIAGLCVFSFLCIKLSAQSVPLYRLSMEPFTYVPVKPELCSDKSFLDISYQFDPILSEKPQNNDDAFNSIAHAHHFDVLYFKRKPGYSCFLNCAYTDLFAAYRDDNETYAVTFDRKEADVSAGFTLDRKPFSLGLGLGFHMPDYIRNEYIENSSTEYDRIFSIDPWQFSLGCKINHNPFAWDLNLFSGPVHSSLTRVINKETGSFRSFGLTLYRKSVQTGCDFENENIWLRLAVHYMRFNNSELIQSKNSMPSSVELSTYGGLTSGWFKAQVSDSIFWKLSGDLSGGWVSAYNFQKDRYTVFDTDSIRMQMVNYTVGIRLPRKINAGITATYFTAQAPMGYLRLSSFSNWSLFKPLDYRFENGSLRYYETGVFVNQPFTLRSLQYNSGIDCVILQGRDEF